MKGFDMRASLVSRARTPAFSHLRYGLAIREGLLLSASKYSGPDVVAPEEMDHYKLGWEEADYVSAPWFAELEYYQRMVPGITETEIIKEMNLWREGVESLEGMPMRLFQALAGVHYGAS
jgi:hypothetical protein